MTDTLPIHIDLDGDNNWYAIRLSMSYKPHDPIPTHSELIERRGYQIDGHCNVKELVKDLGLEYTNEIKRRR